MLKRILMILISATIFAGSAYVPPTYAASADIIITQVQAGGEGAALQELTVIYNNGDQEVDITNWCLQNKAPVNFACFTTDSVDQRMFLPGRSFATVASTEFAASIGLDIFTVTYPPTNQNSGSIVGSSDSISLVDGTGQVVDVASWATTLVGGTAMARLVATNEPLAYQNSGNPEDWQIQTLNFIPDNQAIVREVEIDLCVNLDGNQTLIPDGYGVNETGECYPDVCPNIDGLQDLIPETMELTDEGCALIDVCPNVAEAQYELPDGYTMDEYGNCWLIVLPIAITELLPNAKGDDNGNEFIELYNPSDVDIDLQNYRIQVGQEFEKEYTFPNGSVMLAGEYISFTNSQINYTLLNTSSRVRIVSIDGQIISETSLYQDPKDDTSWALIDGVWQYTNRPTPGAPNLNWYTEKVVTISTASTASTLKPCASNQYRNPQTNRCRLVTTTSSSLVPCDPGEERNPQTNRCRKVASSSELAPCKEGQERNPQTNRCRNSTDVTEADYGVLAADTSNENRTWYIWIAVGVISLLAAGYAIWEWRFEIVKLSKRLLVFARLRK